MMKQLLVVRKGLSLLKHVLRASSALQAPTPPRRTRVHLGNMEINQEWEVLMTATIVTEVGPVIICNYMFINQVVLTSRQRRDVSVF